MKKEKAARTTIQLFTPWGQAVSKAAAEDASFVPLPEYPRPQMKRDSYYPLNGWWEYAITKKGERPFVQENGSRKFRPDGRILVPFSPETALSGVNRILQPDEVLWYRRNLPSEAINIKSGDSRPLSGNRLLLHLGAVDQVCRVFVNRKEVGSHQGGYLPFSCDITEALHMNPTGSGAQAEENELIVAVSDVTDTSWFSRGKQKLNHDGMYYTPSSGIWQSVWLEQVPAAYISDISMNSTGSVLTLNAHVSGVENAGADLRIDVLLGEPGLYKESTNQAITESTDRGPIAECSGKPEETIEIKPNDASGGVKHWSPEEPWLYPLAVRLMRDGECVDEVLSYSAFRAFSIEKDEGGIPRFCLNHKPLYLKGVLDQGYYPEGLYTAPSDESQLFDLKEMKALGFNMVRKHAKIEPDTWYAHCDRLGLIVWQDLVNGGSSYKDWFVTYLATLLWQVPIRISDKFRFLLSRQSKEGRDDFERELADTVTVLKNHPSIATWVLFNEGWGQFDTNRLTEKLKALDPTRPVDAASGWFDQGGGDFRSIHNYFFKLRFKPEKERALVLSEFGGYTYPEKGHLWTEVDSYGYKTYTDKDSLNQDFASLIKEVDSWEEKGLCGYVYTQWTDIESEINGVYTYDRKIRKLEKLPD